MVNRDKKENKLSSEYNANNCTNLCMFSIARICNYVTTFIMSSVQHLYVLNNKVFFTLAGLNYFMHFPKLYLFFFLPQHLNFISLDVKEMQLLQ